MACITHISVLFGSFKFDALGHYSDSEPLHRQLIPRFIFIYLQFFFASVRFGVCVLRLLSAAWFDRMGKASSVRYQFLVFVVLLINFFFVVWKLLIYGTIQRLTVFPPFEIVHPVRCWRILGELMLCDTKPNRSSDEYSRFPNRFNYRNAKRWIQSKRLKVAAQELTNWNSNRNKDSLQPQRLARSEVSRVH